MNLGLPYPPVSRQLGCVFKAVGVVAIVMGVSFGIATITGSFLWLEAAFRLCFGWMHRLWQTIPEITITPMSVANGVGALLIGGISLHYTMTALYRCIKPGSCWRIKWSASLVAGVMLMFGICMSVSGIGTHLALLFQESIRQPSLLRAEFDDLRSARLLASAFRWSDMEPGFVRARNWSELEKRGESRTRPLEDLALLNASSRIDVPEVWTYLGWVGDIELENTLVFCAPRPYSSECRLVIFSNGEVKRCTPQEFEEAMSYWRFVRAKNLHAKSIRTGGSSP